MSGTFWFGWACGLGGSLLGQVWRYWGSRSARARRRRIAILEYDLGYSDKPITEAQRHDRHVKQLSAMYKAQARWASRVNGERS